MSFEKTSTPLPDTAFVYKKATAPDNFVLHPGPGPAGSYPDRADAANAAALLIGPPSNCVEACVFVADPNGHFTNVTGGD